MKTRYELLEYTALINNKEMPKEIVNKILSFLKNKEFDCVINSEMKKKALEEVREELMTVLDPPARVEDIDSLLALRGKSVYLVRWYLEIDSTRLDEVQSFLNTLVTEYTFPLILVEDVNVTK